MHYFSNLIFLIIHAIFCRIKGDLDYQISVPEFICDKNNEGNEIKSSTTTIGLEGEAKLNFRLTFKRMGGPCSNNQRCNLMVWKVIRDFETYLNNYKYEQTNSIEFNNSMLVPGMKYIFNVYVTQGKIKEEKQFSLDFVDHTDSDLEKKPLASIFLIGSTVAEAHMPYMLNAKVSICSNISGYYIEWKLLDETHNILDTFPDKGLQLTVPAFTLQMGRKYSIKCSLIKMENDETVTTNMKIINVKNNLDSLILKLPMIYTTVNVQQPINIKPYVMDIGNQEGNVEKRWFCIYRGSDLCENRNDDILNIEGGFLDAGDYNISLKITKGSVVKEDYSIIKVLKDVPSIEIDTIQCPVLPASGVEIRANIDNLRTFCTLQWKSEEEPYFLDLNIVPGNVNEIFEVVVKRDLFLQELEEFSNDVSNKEHNLLIPPPSEMWSGLPIRDENYKLRFILEAKCPKVQLESDETEVEFSEDMLNDTLVVSALVEVEVNVPPKAQSLIIEPSSGISLETVFSFKTSEAVETGTTKPFLYKFGYVLGDREYEFCTMVDYIKCETILPYSENGVATFLEVCNSFSSCDKIFGPVLNTTISDTINEKSVLRIFKEKLNSEDFYKAFGYALTVLQTSRASMEDEKYMELFSTEVFNKINFLLKYYSDETNWAKRANKFITYVSDFNKDLSFSDDVLNGLVELRAKLLDAQKENFVSLRRKLLSINKRLNDLDSFKSYIEVSDLIISSSKDQNRVELEKEQLRQKINEYLGKLCIELYQTKKKVSLVFKSVILMVEELPKKSYGNVHVIPYARNPWNTTAEIKFKMEDMMKMVDKKLCIAKIVYKNFFNKSGMVYEAEILNSEGGSIVSENIETTILIPISLKNEEVADKIPKCMIYKNQWKESCKFVKVITKLAQCICSNVGSYYLEYEDKPRPGTDIPITRINNTDPTTRNEIKTTKSLPEAPKITTKSINHLDSTAIPIVKEGINTLSNVTSTSIPQGTLTYPSTYRSTSNSREGNGGIIDNVTKASLSDEKTDPSASEEDNAAVIVSYVIIATALAGIGFLYFVSRKMSISSVHDVYMEDLESPNYARLQDEDSLK